MADNKQQKNVKDSRVACKYGAKCYQQNAAHQQKYKHPPATKADSDDQPKKKIKLDFKVTKKIEDVKVPPTDPPEDTKNNSDDHDQQSNITDLSGPELSKINDNKERLEDTKQEYLGQTPKVFEPKDFIKEKFLVEMPEDFYSFWDFCKGLKEKCPQEALKEIGLTLVGPYDVLAGKFYDVPDQCIENYLIHWRYFYDPPEIQTVLKGDDKTGFHIGYFRDLPKEMPGYLASNCAKTDGTFKIMGDNIFGAVYLYLEDLKKTGDPFKRMHVGRFQNSIKKKAEELNLSLSQSTQKTSDRDKKIVTRSFSKMGIIVPYDRKTQRGYRDLAMSKRELAKLFDDIQNASPEIKQGYLSDLQNVLTNVSIATDECDFGTGIQLGLNILAHGVDCLNQTASRFLAINYRLIDREEFAKIIEAHMKHRKKDGNLSII